MPEDRTIGYECPVCGNGLRLDSGEGDGPRSVYCAECETDFPEILARLDGETAERVRLLPLLERLLARLEGRDRGETCTAVIHHGPGHQSRTPCQMRGEHVIHMAVYGRYDEVARWTGQSVFSGYHDEPPGEPDVEEPKRPDVLLADLRRELGRPEEG